MSDGTSPLCYYPGCLAGETAREYDASIRLLAGLTGIELETIDDWNCCGAGVVQDIDPKGGQALAKRNLDRAAGRTVVSGCPTCVAMLQDAGGPESARHLLGLLSSGDVRGKIAAKITDTGEKRPLGSLKVACFYGCGLSRRQAWAGSDENAPPSPIEDLMQLAGATPVKWPGGLRCCGGYLLFAKPDLGFTMLEKLFRDFEKSGADALVTACPHCHFNLDSFQYEVGRRRRHALEVPVLHFTEVLALALSVEQADTWLERHVTSAFPLIDRLCVEEERRKAAEEKREKAEDRKTKSG